MSVMKVQLKYRHYDSVVDPNAAHILPIKGRAYRGGTDVCV